MSALLIKLQEDQSEGLLKMGKLTDRRWRIFKSWYKRNLWKRFTTHTAGMSPAALLTNWLYTKLLDDTFRGSIKDANTSKDAGEHGYGPDTRLIWSNEVIQEALAIVLDSRELIVMFLSGKTYSARLLLDIVAQVLTDATNELIEQFQPESPDRVVVSIKLPDGSPANPTIRQLQMMYLTAQFALVSRPAI